MARTLYLAGARLDSSVDSELSMAQPNTLAAVSPRSPMRFPRPRFAWLAVAVVLVLAVTTSWLAVENGRLRQQDRTSRAAFGSLSQELRQLHAQVESLQNSKAAAADENVPRVIDHPTRLISSIFLLPPTRGGASTIPVASVTQRDQWLRLQLALESDDCSEYQVDLMDLEGNKYIWHSGRVKSTDVNHRRALTLLLPVGPLKTQRYAAEVSGIAADRRQEELGSYVFRIAQAPSRQDGGR